MINELAGNASLDRFRAEYEKLHNALREANTSNQRLSTKCRELNAEIVANSSKVAQERISEVALLRGHSRSFRGHYKVTFW